VHPKGPECLPAACFWLGRNLSFCCSCNSDMVCLYGSVTLYPRMRELHIYGVCDGEGLGLIKALAAWVTQVALEWVVIGSN